MIELPSIFEDARRGHLLTRGGIHEASHAALDVIGGFPPGATHVWIVGDSVAGVTEMASMEVTLGKLPDWLIACVGGQVGEAMWLAMYKGMTFDAAMADAQGGAAGDMEHFRRYGGRTPPLSLAEARLHARQLLTPRWRFLEAHAATLMRHGTASARVPAKAQGKTRKETSSTGSGSLKTPER